MPLTVGQRVTVLRIDDALAMTQRFEFDVRSVLKPHPVGYEGRKQRVAVVRQRGKRKDFFLDVATDDIVLDGWELPFKTDNEGGGVFSGNACFNLVGAPETIRECIEGRAVLPVSDSAKAKIIVTRGERTTCTDDGLILLYPDIDTRHAVINRLKGA
ncbi:MAG TPA: hypothetical protein VL371_00150 [Gemmataceae bacterium]|jgi:hypothetical protein|nr:hypothetical protein [Gemmataceae bacterium]